MHLMDSANTLRVALLAEGVDRNKIKATHLLLRTESPSSRRAWIEMSPLVYHNRGVFVALLAEGVDRNLLSVASKATASVALLAEGVDRNPEIYMRLYEAGGRPPRGGRG